MKTVSFGDFIRQKRLHNGLTLRIFCNRFGFDTAYVSRLENSKLLPPKNKEKLTAIAEALRIEEGSKGWVRFFDLAYQARKELPPDIRKEAPEVVSALPAFLRKSKDGKIHKKKVEALVDFLTKKED